MQFQNLFELILFSVITRAQIFMSSAFSYTIGSFQEMGAVRTRF